MKTIRLRNAKFVYHSNRVVINTFDVSKAQQVKYNSAGTYIYENSTDESTSISYILPLRVKPGTTLKIKTKNNPYFEYDSSMATGAVHYLGDVNPLVLTPREILKTDCIADGNSIAYDNFYNDSEVSCVIPSGCHAIELYMWDSRFNQTPTSRIATILDKVSVVEE